MGIAGVGRGANAARVFYDKVNAMLLNQVQTQQGLIANLESRLAELESRAK